MIQFLKAAYKKLGRCIILPDKASQHTSKAMKRWAGRHGVILRYFPTGTPDLNVTEQYQNGIRRAV